jgi:hypothetical protein
VTSVVKSYARVALAVAVLAAVATALSTARPASAAAPKKPACWKVLLTDWYDGRIDRTYPLACYREALKHLPTDVDIYSSARQDIQRALASAVAHHRATVPPTPSPASNTGTTTTTTTTTGGTSGGSEPPTTTAASGKDENPSASPGRSSNDDGPVTGLLGSVSDSADSVPVPLLILGGLAVLLIGAGVAGMIVRRHQTRDAGP